MKMLEFGGFYESVHSHNIEQAYAMSCDADDFDSEIVESEHYQHYLDNVRKYETDYAEAYIESLNKFFATNFKFVRIDSPTYYNYTTDAIEVDQDCSSIDCELFNSSQEFIDFSIDFSLNFIK